MSIFKDVSPLPPDPIFGLASHYKKDPRLEKVDLTVGIYHTEELKNIKMESVLEAEKRLIQTEENKTYLPMEGNAEFIQLSKELAFGKELVSQFGEKLLGAQSVGGTGALRIGAELLRREVSKHIVVPSPTWPNHEAIFKASGMELSTYPYYDREKNALDFEKMREHLLTLPPKTVVVLHCCCHNPTGCDPTQEQWKELSSILLERKLVPFFDFAYQGLGSGIEEDAFPIRYFAKMGHEMMVAFSFSKSFALYGERVGSLFVLSQNEEFSNNLSTILKYLVRVKFSNPPRHGASIVSTILQDKALREMWEKELAKVRRRIKEMRQVFCEALFAKSGSNSWSFLKNQNGLFSILGLQKTEVDRLIKEYGIYTNNGRVNLTGLGRKNMSYVVESILNVRNA